MRLAFLLSAFEFATPLRILASGLSNVGKKRDVVVKNKQNQRSEVWHSLSILMPLLFDISNGTQNTECSSDRSQPY
jgi:hypothetical protein